MAKVLLVEDDNNLREIYEARLAAEGYEISSAQDGEEALVVAKQTKPDLVVSDVMMPKISGFEMLDILRNTPGLEHVKVIMLTALGQSEDRDRADSLGADKYLVKSQVTLEDIVKTAHELLGDVAASAPAAPAAAVTPTTDTTPVAEPVAPQPAPLAPEPTAVTPPPAEPSTSVAVPDTTDPTAVSDDTATAIATPTEPGEAVPPSEEPTVEASEPAVASNDLAGSTAQEQATVTDQINAFIEQAPETVATTEAAAPTDSDAATTADDQIMANAVTELTNNVESPAAPAVVAPTEPNVSEPTAVTEPSETTSASDVKEEAEKTNISISGKKVIQPLDSEPKPDINELLAREEASVGNPVTGAAVIAGSEEGEDQPIETEIDETPAIVHQPGQSFAPQSSPETTPEASPVSDEDVPSGGPMPAPSENDKDKDGIDPNSVAL
jgi:CheY-like chemotaxis protein